MSLHRFPQFGDLHLGPNARNADRIAALDQAIAQEILQPVAAWLWPGDLNHGRMTIDDRNILVPRVQRMANVAPVLVIIGNHDLPGDLDFLEQLHAVFPIYVVSKPCVFTFRTSTYQDVTVFALPYPHRAGLVAAGVAPAGVVDAAAHALDVIFMDAAIKLEQARAKGDITMMLGHVNVAGSITSSGQPNIGKEIELHQTMLDRLGPIYKGLNHIHRAQEIDGAVYAGSMCRLDWGETEPKSYVVVECTATTSIVAVADGTPSRRWLYAVERRPLDVAPMYHVEGELTREGFEWNVVGDGGVALEGYEALRSGFFEGAEVRVRYRFNADDVSALDKSLVSAPFVGAKRIDPDPIAVHNRAARAPEVAAAQSLEDKVQAFVRQSQQPWSHGLEAKLSVLQSPDGAEFLTMVQNALSIKTAAPEDLVEVEL